jgi:threonine dehydrogenase-like Zn-dependent dehydrogenase
VKAACWYGKHDVRVESVPDPDVLNPHDAVVRVTLSAICGSDLHMYDGYIPSMRRGDVLGHEFMGEVVSTGSDVMTLHVGDRVVVPFAIACGRCTYCRQGLSSLCDNTNPNAALADLAYGHSGAGLFGYSHMFGGYAGGQAELVRVPFADVGCLKIESDLTDEQVLFLGDILPTGWMAAENCQIVPGDVIAVFGCGPVGQLAIRSAWLLGADRVIAIDDVPERLEMARTHGRAEIIDQSKTPVLEQLAELTGGRGPDACIDAVGMEAHGSNALESAYDRVKHALRLETDRPGALRMALMACKKGGTVSIPGVYGGVLDKVPLGAAFAKGLTLKMGQTNVHRYMRPLLARIEAGELDPSFVITHRDSLANTPMEYERFLNKQDGCVKVVLRP